MRRIRTIMLAASLAGVAFSLPAIAADHEVKMLNKGSDGEMMVFEPAYLKIAPGDTVTFIATDKGHNSEAIKGMVPEGAEMWKGKINEEIKVTFDQEGVYGYRCAPHYGMGMVGLIQVGDNPANLEQAKAVKLPNKAAERMTAYFEQASATQ
ncbi:pseudoazurin [Chelativorans sp. J32]|uniref:pseudoazurin n=1 Tax=Chelativorans sp. J32 TaxID=935840 RepID=UPI000487A37D|nr:pseudoazurin [Chelativorans sp. J32]